METIGMTIALAIFCLFGIGFGIIELYKLNFTSELDVGDDLWILSVVPYSGVCISLFIFLLIILEALLSWTPFQAAKGTIVYFITLTVIRVLIAFSMAIPTHYEKIKEALEKEATVEKKINKKSEQRIISKAQRKNMGQLIHQIKKESSNLILLTNEEIAEMVDAIRKKAHQVYNEFTSRKTAFEDAQAVLEEAVSDLLSLNEMLRPRRPDVVTFDDILGIKPGDSKEEIKKAYKNLIQVVHPDRISQELREKAGEITSLINSAYEYVKNNNGRCA